MVLVALVKQIVLMTIMMFLLRNLAHHEQMDRVRNSTEGPRAAEHRKQQG